MPSWIDSHNHLHDPRLSPTIDQWWPQMTAAGVSAAVVNGTSPDDWDAVAELRRRHPDLVFACYGLHPWRVRGAPADWKDRLVDMLDREPCVGIGESGLDKWIRDPELPRQKEALRWQWQLAFERDLPVTVHCLRAWGHLIEMLRELPRLRRGFLLHSFAGPADMVPELVALRAHFSFSGHLMHERKQAGALVFRDSIPHHRLHVETDAPDMPPPPSKHVRFIEPLQPVGSPPLNHPSNLPVIGRFLAELLGLPESEIATRCANNTRQLFHLP